ncbi:hypothetical protein JCM6882_001491 [Rhodosporidiobolus microsporus]
MASTALPVLRASRQSLVQRAAALVASSPIFSLASARAAPAAVLPSAALASTSTSASISLSTAPAALSLASLIPDTLAGLRDLLPPWVLAVPKSKTTHSAKRMRSANKGLKEKQNLVSCPSCGAPKLAHHLCHDCHTAFRREIHREAKEAKAQAPRL